MRSRLIKIPTIILFSLLTICVWGGESQDSFADTLYVATNGNNQRSRAQARNRSTPWRTIQRAVDEANPSDEVVVLSGQYNESVQIRRSGQPNRDILVRAENSQGARLVGSFSTSDQSYITIEGFDVSNFNSFGQTKGIDFVRCHHVTVRSCRVRDCFGGGIGFDQSDWILCEWNIVHGNAFFNPGQHSGISVYQPQYRGDDNRRFGIIIRNNTSFENRNLVNNVNFGRPTDGNGIVVDDYFNEQQPTGNGVRYDRETTIENNLCFDNGGQGVHCFRSQNIRIRNNTCRNNLDSFEFGGEVSVVESERVYVYNNVLIAAPNRFAAFQFESAEAIFFFNLFDGPTQEVQFDFSNINEDAQLIPGTFELSNSSPGRNRGFDTGDHFFLDVTGQNRFEGPLDMGAIEAR